MIELMSRYWWLVALRGVVSILFGIAAFAWPLATLFVLVIFFGAYMLVDGIFALAQAVRLRHERMQWPTFLLEGILGILAGALSLVLPGITAIAWIYVIAAWAIVTGIIEIVAAMHLRSVLAGEIFLLLTGVVSLALGFAFIVMPVVSLVVWAWLIGAYAVAFGVFLLGLAFRMHSAGSTTHLPGRPLISP